jgi:hypothetical protein
MYGSPADAAVKASALAWVSQIRRNKSDVMHEGA